MANLKNITELPVAESADGLNLIVNDNGAAKQIAASAVGAQADWAVTDETSPAYVRNKPMIPTKMSDLEEEWDFDANVTVSWDANSSSMVHSYTVNFSNFESCKNKIMNGIQPKAKIVWYEQAGENTPSAYGIPYKGMYIIPAEAMGEGSPEMIELEVEGMNYDVYLALLPDNSVMDIT